MEKVSAEVGGRENAGTASLRFPNAMLIFRSSGRPREMSLTRCRTSLLEFRDPLPSQLCQLDVLRKIVHIAGLQITDVAIRQLLDQSLVTEMPQFRPQIALRLIFLSSPLGDIDQMHAFRLRN